MSVSKKIIRENVRRIDQIKEEDIDYSDIPPVDDSFFTRATINIPKPKKSITLRIDPEVLEWFQKQGKGYQTKINAILKSYFKVHKHSV